MSDRLVVGTRASALAITQTGLIVDLLRAQHPGADVSVVTIQTRGDEFRDRPISAIGDKGVFVRALEAALMAGEIDLAVHSLKDVPADRETPGLVLAAFGPRADPRDVLVSGSGSSLAGLPGGAVVGTSSPRRRVLLQSVRPDLHVRDIRGNVDTRLRKLDEGQYDALILAAAGLERLGLSARVSEYLPADVFVPDAGQGILAVQTRETGKPRELAAAIGDEAAATAAVAERAVVRALGADCHSPVGAYAAIEQGRILIHGMAAADAGGMPARSRTEGSARNAEQLGAALGLELLRLIESQAAPILDRD